ncbi:MAG: hypothetical protein ACLPWD_01345 [Methanobacterium sp.]
MTDYNIFNGIIILIFAFIGWALCAAVMGIGMKITSINRTLIIHAIAAPLIFIGLSVIYFNYFNFTTPLETGIIFMSFVILMDIFVVALIINKSFEMFKSLIGTWIPFILIFTATYLTGIYLIR